jgi:hypothetical protein
MNQLINFINAYIPNPPNDEFYTFVKSMEFRDHSGKTIYNYEPLIEVITSNQHLVEKIYYINDWICKVKYVQNTIKEHPFWTVQWMQINKN